MDYIVWSETCNLIEIFCHQCFFGPFVTAPLGFVLFGSDLWFLTPNSSVRAFALPYTVLPFRAWESFSATAFFPFAPWTLGCVSSGGLSFSELLVDTAAKFFWLWAEWRLGTCHSFAAVKLKECCMACWKLLSGLRWGVYEGVCREWRVL